MKLNNEKKEKYLMIFWIGFILLIWQLSIVYGGISKLILPGPKEVLFTLVDSIVNGDIIYQTYYSLKIIGIGMSIATFLAIVIALASQRYILVSSLAKVMGVIGHPLPALAVLPLIIIWFGTGDASITAIIVHSAVWPILLNLNAGFAAVPQMYIDTGRNLELNQLLIAFEIKLKFSLGYLISGLKIAFARSWRALIGAEMVFGAIGLKGGIGWYIFKQRTFMNTSGLFAGIIMVIIVGLLIETFLFNYIEKKTVKKWSINSYSN